MARTLVLIRHGQSEWNLKNLFTGWRDPVLTDKGHEEAILAGKRLKALGLQFDITFTSVLQRAQVTCQHILDEMGQTMCKSMSNQALNERDYGVLSGLNKDDACKKWGEEQVYVWRRSYEIPPPGGESLRDTGARVWPYYIHIIQPYVLRGNTVLVAAHGNSLRALMMALEGLNNQDIIKKELATGVPIIYQLNTDSSIARKKIVEV